MKSPTEEISDHLSRFRDDCLLILEPTEIRTIQLGHILIRNPAIPSDPSLEKQHLDAKPIFSKTLYPPPKTDTLNAAPFRINSRQRRTSAASHNVPRESPSKTGSFVDLLRSGNLR